MTAFQKQAEQKQARAGAFRAWWKRFLASVRYSFYVMFHPFDGFWDLTHEHRGSIGAANFFVILLLVSRLLTLQGTNMMFLQVYWPKVNIFQQCISLLMPLGIFCICNWGLTTLFDGKGTLKDVYMATAYALVPYIIGALVVIPLSNMLTLEEGSFISVIPIQQVALPMFIAFMATSVFVGVFGGVNAIKNYLKV